MSQLSLPLSYEAIIGTKLEKQRYNDVATIVKIIKTTKNRRKTKKEILFRCGLPPESASLMPLARLNANRSSLFKKITSPCDGLKRQLNLFPREVFHPFLERELEFYNPFFHINSSTHGAKKRTSQNNWTRRFTFNVHNSKIT